MTYTIKLPMEKKNIQNIFPLDDNNNSSTMFKYNYNNMKDYNKIFLNYTNDNINSVKTCTNEKYIHLPIKENTNVNNIIYENIKNNTNNTNINNIYDKYKKNSNMNVNKYNISDYKRRFIYPHIYDKDMLKNIKNDKENIIIEKKKYMSDAINYKENIRDNYIRIDNEHLYNYNTTNNLPYINKNDLKKYNDNIILNNNLNIYNKLNKRENYLNTNIMNEYNNTNEKNRNMLQKNDIENNLFISANKSNPIYVNNTSYKNILQKNVDVNKYEQLQYNLDKLNLNNKKELIQNDAEKVYVIKKNDQFINNQKLYMKNYNNCEKLNKLSEINKIYVPNKKNIYYQHNLSNNKIAQTNSGKINMDVNKFEQFIKKKNEIKNISGNINDIINNNKSKTGDISTIYLSKEKIFNENIYPKNATVRLQYLKENELKKKIIETKENFIRYIIRDKNKENNFNKTIISYNNTNNLNNYILYSNKNENIYEKISKPSFMKVNNNNVNKIDLINKNDENIISTKKIYIKNNETNNVLKPINDITNDILNESLKNKIIKNHLKIENNFSNLRDYKNLNENKNMYETNIKSENMKNKEVNNEKDINNLKKYIIKSNNMYYIKNTENNLYNDPNNIIINSNNFNKVIKNSKINNDEKKIKMEKKAEMSLIEQMDKLSNNEKIIKLDNNIDVNTNKINTYVGQKKSIEEDKAINDTNKKKENIIKKEVVENDKTDRDTSSNTSSLSTYTSLKEKKTLKKISDIKENETKEEKDKENNTLYGTTAGLNNASNINQNNLNNTSNIFLSNKIQHNPGFLSNRYLKNNKNKSYEIIFKPPMNLNKQNIDKNHNLFNKDLELKNKDINLKENKSLINPIININENINSIGKPLNIDANNTRNLLDLNNLNKQNIYNINKINVQSMFNLSNTDSQKISNLNNINTQHLSNLNNMNTQNLSNLNNINTHNLSNLNSINSQMLSNLNNTNSQMLSNLNNTNIQKISNLNNINIRNMISNSNIVLNENYQTNNKQNNKQNNEQNNEQNKNSNLNTSNFINVFKRTEEVKEENNVKYSKNIFKSSSLSPRIVYNNNTINDITKGNTSNNVVFSKKNVLNNSMNNTSKEENMKYIKYNINNEKISASNPIYYQRTYLNDMTKYYNLSESKTNILYNKSNTLYTKSDLLDKSKTIKNTIINNKLNKTVHEKDSKNSENIKNLNELKKKFEDDEAVTKKAIIIGCNYIRDKEERLYGCVNDAYAFARTLVKYFNYDPNNILLLVDSLPSNAYIDEYYDLKKIKENQNQNQNHLNKESNNEIKKKKIFNLFLNDNNDNEINSIKNVNDNSIIDLTSNLVPIELWPTKTNVLKAVNWLVRDSIPYGSYVFYFAGKSIQVDNLSGWEGEGYDEAILCSDQSAIICNNEKNVITNVQLKDMLLSINPYAKMTIIMDTSGGQTILNSSGSDGLLRYIKGCKPKGIWPISNPTNKVYKAYYNSSIFKHNSMIQHFTKGRYAKLIQVNSTAAMKDPVLQAISPLPIDVRAHCLCGATWSEISVEGLFPIIKFVRKKQYEDNSNIEKDIFVSHGVFTYCLIEAISEFKNEEIKNNVFETFTDIDKYVPMTAKNLTNKVIEKIQKIKNNKMKKLNQKPGLTINPCAAVDKNNYFLNFSKHVKFQNIQFDYLNPDLSPFLNIFNAWNELTANNLRKQKLCLTLTSSLNRKAREMANEEYANINKTILQS